MRVACRVLMRYRFATATPTVPYREVALPKDTFYKQLTKRAFRVPKEEIFRLYEMMERGAMPAHHDFINDSGLRLLSFQKQLSLDELVQVMRVFVKFQVNSLPLIRHIENELYGRYFLQLSNELVAINEREALAREEKFLAFEKSNQDYFGLLTPEFVEEQKQQNPDEEVAEQPPSNTNVQLKWSEQETQLIASYEKSYGHLSLDVMCRIADLLIKLDCEETRLLRLFSEYFMTVKEVTTEQLILFVKVHSHVCTKIGQEYQANKQEYTLRSRKRLRKYHEHFFAMVAPQFKLLEKQLDMKQLQEIFKAVASYPPKRRAIKRMMITAYLNSPEVDTSPLSLPNCQLVADILGTDKRLMKAIEEKQKFLTEQQSKSLQTQTEPKHRTIIFN